MSNICVFKLIQLFFVFCVILCRYSQILIIYFLMKVLGKLYPGYHKATYQEYIKL